MYIKHSELKSVEFKRTGGGGRTFDLSLTTISGEQNVNFVSIEKSEQKGLFEYFKAAGIKIKAEDHQGNISDMKEFADDNKRGGDANMAEDDDDDEDDDSFNEKDASNQGSEDDEEAGEDDFDDDDDSDVEMDEIDKSELKRLQKDAEDLNLGERRPRRGAKKE